MTQQDANPSFAPIFIVGSPRSGTTLLAVMLDRHPNVAITPETFFFHNAPEEWLRGEVDRRAVARHFLGGPPMNALGLPVEEFVEIWRDHPPTLREFLRLALAEYARRKGREHAGEKTATHLYHIPLMLKWFPEAKVIWIVRDGRDVVMSMMRQPRFHNGLRRHCHSWRRMMLIGEKYEKAHPGRIRRVSFERLIREPEAELEPLHRWLGVDFDGGETSPGRPSGAVLAKDMAFQGRALGALDPSTVGAWRREASPDQQITMNAILRRTLKRLGYEVAAGEAGTPARRAAETLVNLPAYAANRPSVYFAIQRIRRLFRRNRPPAAPVPQSPAPVRAVQGE